MLTYKGGNPAKDGFYWKKGEWEIVTVEGKKGKLPGGAECEYIKAPALLFVPVALTLSVLFVIFLPFIGFAMLFVMIGMKTGQSLAALGSRVAGSLAQSWAQLIGITPRLRTATPFGTGPVIVTDAGLRGRGAARVREREEDSMAEATEEPEEDTKDESGTEHANHMGHV